MPVSAASAGVVTLFITAIYWAKSEAAAWLRGARREGPMRYYTIVSTSIVLGTALIVYRLYIDYQEIDPVVLVAWILFLLAEAWILWHVVPQDFALIRSMNAVQNSTTKQHQPLPPAEHTPESITITSESSLPDTVASK